MKKNTAEPDWFSDAKYGLFIHWGMYSLFGRGEQVLYREHLRPSDYRAMAEQFRPTHFDARHWARVAKEGGMRYAILTAKHHDGFCMWDTRSTAYCAARTGLRCDYVAAFLDAFREAGLRVGLYFSTADWSQPAYFAGPRRDPKGFRQFIEYTHEQVLELCSRYGCLDVLWFDGAWPYTPSEWRARRLIQEVRRLQPHILVNDRIGLRGDFATPEQSIPEQQFKPQRPWESCLTPTVKWWGYHAGVRWKTDLEAVRELCSVVEVGGNLLYNVGPMADGTLPPQFERLMQKVGAWLRLNGESIFGTTETICDTTTFGLMTCGRRSVYLHVLHWPGRQLRLAGLKSRVRSARFLATGKPLSFKQDSAAVAIIGLPSRAPDPRSTVIALDLDEPPRSHPWARERIWTGALDKTPEHSRRVAARMYRWSCT